MAINPFDKIYKEEQVILSKETRSRNSLIRRVISELSFPSVYTVVRFQDLSQRVKSLFHKSVITEFTSYRSGQKIALVAIWEYEVPREDILILLQILKEKDFYVCVVNTGKIKSEIFSDMASVYIQRFNYGRDFGSYQEGIQYLQRGNKLAQADKFLLCNDSIYFLSDLMPPALEEFLVSDYDVLGATENFEIVPHIGSFFFLMTNRAVNSKEFKSFWKKFKKTDIRLKNIKYGEMRLSEKLRRGIPEGKMGAYWSLSFLSEKCDTEESLSQAIRLSNRGHITGWKKLSWQFVLKAFLTERVLFSSDLSRNQGIIFQETAAGEPNTSTPELILSHQDAVTVIAKQFNKELSSDSQTDLILKAKGLWVSTAASGSQIHQNNNLLVSLGCPIVKLDLIYRGAFSYEDAEIMFDQIKNKDDVYRLRRLLYSRAYGADTLRGWRRSGFEKGLI